MAERIRVLVPNVQGGAQVWKTYLAGTTAADIFDANPHVQRELRQLDGTDCYVGSQAPPPGEYQLTIRQAGLEPPVAPRSVFVPTQALLRRKSKALSGTPTVEEAREIIAKAITDPGWQLPVNPEPYRMLVDDNQELSKFIMPTDDDSVLRGFVTACVLDDLYSLSLRNEITVAGIIDNVLTTMFRYIRAAHGIPIQITRNEKASSSASSNRPDFLILVPNGDQLVMLCEGEDKAEGKLQEATQDLVDKSRLLFKNDAYSELVKYVPAYAAAGSQLQLCLVLRPTSADIPTVDSNLIPVGDVLELCTPLGRAQLLMAAFALFRIVRALQAVLIPPARHNSKPFNENGTAIILGDKTFEKTVDTRTQSYLSILEHQDVLRELYSQLRQQGARNVVQPLKDTKLHPLLEGHFYTVYLRPVGERFEHLATVSEMRRFVEDVLTGLGDLHKLGFGHTDVRLANIMRKKRKKPGFFLIDLEMAMPLNARYDPRLHGPERKAWRSNMEALEDGVFTARSDLFMLGGIMHKLIAKSSKLQGCSEVQSLCTSLRKKELDSADIALQHPFLARGQRRARRGRATPPLAVPHRPSPSTARRDPHQALGHVCLPRWRPELRKAVLRGCPRVHVRVAAHQTATALR